MNAVSTMETRLEYATVINIDNKRIFVELNEQIVIAYLSVSCLLKPEIDDKVLISVDEENRCYIISILERTENLNNNIVFEGNTNFQVTDGSLHMIADNSVNTVAGEELNLVGNKATITTPEMNVNAEKMTFLCKIFSGKLKTVKTVAENIDGFFKRIIMRTKDSYKYIENHDEVQANSVRFLVDGNMNIRTESTNITAEEHVKIDSEQIHLG